MNAFKVKCLELRKQDYSLSEIVRLTGRSKTSVYFHIRNIPLSRERLLKTREKNASHLRHIAENRKGKSSRDFKVFNEWDTSTVSLVAHLLFDGEIKRGGCFYNNRNEALIGIVERCMKNIYTFSPSRYFNTLTGVFRICYFNVALANYIHAKAEELIEKIEHLPKSFKKEFLQAFFDDEGCMDFRPNKNLRRVRGYQKNVKILKLIVRLLDDFGIQSRVQKPNEVVISGQQNLALFQKEIGFSAGVYINGNRTNSVWKKNIEKRTLLSQAIKSYMKVY